MAPASSVHRIALALTAHGGEAPEEGILASTLASVRSRAKITRGSKLSGAGLRELFLRALDPIVRLTQEAFEENHLSAFEDSEYGDLCYEVLMPIMAHTHIKKNFSSILDSDEEWRRVCRALVRARDRPPSSGIARAAATRPASGHVGPPQWYLAKWSMVTWFLGWACSFSTLSLQC